MNRDERTYLRYEVVRRKKRGESNRSIARVLDIDRRTVKKLLREAEQWRTEGDDALERELGPTRTPRASKLDAHRKYIAQRFDKHPKLRVTTLLKELKARGYNGGYSILREYVNEVRPKPAKTAATRVEHHPGKQAQVDWSPYKLARGDGTEVSAWAAVLSYSKLSYEHFTTNQKQPTVFRELHRSFEAFDGVSDEVVFDSMSGIVDRWEMNEPILNIRAIDFAAYYGFALHIAPRASGQYKGIVEHRFLDTENSLLDGAEFRSIEELNAACARWLAEQNERVHGTTNRRPVDLWDEEKALLQPLPARPYDTRDLAYRVVDGYGRIHFEGNRYTVPPVYVGRWVYVRADEQRVEIFDGQANRLAEHERRPAGSNLDVTAPEHQPSRKRVSYDILLARFTEWGDEAVAYAEEVKRCKRYARAQLVAILELQRIYDADDIMDAIRHATRFRAFDAQQLTRILELKATPRTLEDQFAERVRQRIRESMADAEFQQRAVGDYAWVFEKAPSPNPGGGQADEQEEDPKSSGGDP